MSAAITPASTESAPEQWPVVGSYMGPFAEAEADLAVCTLKGLGLRALRRPTVPICMIYRMPGIFPVEVCVPSEVAAEAAEALAGQPHGSVSPSLRLLMRWVLAAALTSLVVGGVGIAWGQARAYNPLQSLELVLNLACCVGLIYGTWRLLVTLHKEGRRAVSVAPVVTIVLVWLALSLLMWPVAANDGWLLVMVLALYVVVVVLLPRWLQQRREQGA